MLVLLSETEEGNKQIVHLVEVLNGYKNTLTDSVGDLYVFQSAPWYISIIVYGVFTIIALMIACILKLKGKN